MPHVGEEILERLSPPLADRDAAASVKWPVFSILVVAPNLHGVPRRILGRVFHAMSGGQLPASLSVDLLHKATATLGGAEP